MNRRTCILLGIGSLIAQAAMGAERLSPLAKEPRWSDLRVFDRTISREDFTRLLDTVYAPGGAYRGVIAIGENAATIQTPAGPFTLAFASGASKSPPRTWRPASARKPAAKPLAGVFIALDPGHLGGAWAKMEERWFQIGAETKPVTEGDMTLLVGRLLKTKLQALGADVVSVHHAPEPVTKLRPADLRDEAIAELKARGIASPAERYESLSDPLKGSSIQFVSELLFFRRAEIRARAQIVNTRWQPDLVVCLHFNAEEWGDPLHPTLVEKNHLHVLVNGSYDADELALDDVRHDMLLKLLAGCYAEELPAAEHVANAIARDTGLPPYEYTKPNAHRVGANPYVWARNLLANRLYHCPVVYLEPYVMNSAPVWNRVQLGDYEGEKNIDGAMRKSIYREYADAVASGLAEYYQAVRPR